MTVKREKMEYLSERERNAQNTHLDCFHEVAFRIIHFLNEKIVILHDENYFTSPYFEMNVMMDSILMISMLLLIMLNIKNEFCSFHAVDVGLFINFCECQRNKYIFVKRLTQRYL